MSTTNTKALIKSEGLVKQEEECSTDSLHL